MDVPYEYRDADGQVRYRVVRTVPKAFRIERTDGTPLPDPIPAEMAILYRLDEVAAAPPGETIHVCEGEKDADALAALGWVATSAPCGTRGGWHPQYTASLAGRHVAVLPDADGPGRRRGELVVAELAAMAASVVSVDLWPNQRGPMDVSDWLMRHERRQSPAGAKLREAVAAARYQTVGLDRPPIKEQKGRLILDSRLSSVQKLVLLSLQIHLRWGAGPLPSAREVAEWCSLHRVTTQNVLSDLRHLGVLRGPSDGSVQWDVLAMFARAEVGSTATGTSSSRSGSQGRTPR
jgi:hypothetical protein